MNRYTYTLLRYSAIIGHTLLKISQRHFSGIVDEFGPRKIIKPLQFAEWVFNGKLLTSATPGALQKREFMD